MTELKQNFILNDFVTVSQELANYQSLCKTAQFETDDAISTLRSDLESEIEGLESLLTSSQVRPTLPASNILT